MTFAVGGQFLTRWISWRGQAGSSTWPSGARTWPASWQIRVCLPMIYLEKLPCTSDKQVCQSRSWRMSWLYSTQPQLLKEEAVEANAGIVCHKLSCFTKWRPARQWCQRGRRHRQRSETALIKVSPQSMFKKQWRASTRSMNTFQPLLQHKNKTTRTIRTPSCLMFSTYSTPKSISCAQLPFSNPSPLKTAIQLHSSSPVILKRYVPIAKIQTGWMISWKSPWKCF